MLAGLERRRATLKNVFDMRPNRDVIRRPDTVGRRTVVLVVPCAALTGADGYSAEKRGSRA
jgi:hypothetical protein